MAYFAFKGRENIILLGENNVYMDLVVTTFFFLVLKAIYGASLALVVTPLVSLIALTKAKDMPPS